MRVLVVEDDPKLAALLGRGLREEGVATDVTGRGEDALWMAGSTDYDALVLDVMLPGIDGFEACERLRADGVSTPVLMLTARDAIEDRIAGLDSGADDYLVKPFAFGELLARLRAVIRRGQQPLLPERLIAGPLTLETRSRRVRIRGRDVALTAKEYAFLEYLVRHAGDVITRSEIDEHVWDEHYDPFSNVVDVYVQRLRRKLDQPGIQSLIRTRRGEGYQLTLPAATP